MGEKKKSVYDWLAHPYIDSLGRYHPPCPPTWLALRPPFYRVFSSFFRFLAFPGCPSFCGSHLRLWLCLRFAHPVITAPFSRPIVTIIRRSLRPPLPLVLLYRRSLSSVHNLVDEFVLTCHLLHLINWLFALHHDFISILYTDSLAVLVYHLQHCLVRRSQFYMFSQFLKR